MALFFNRLFVLITIGTFFIGCSKQEPTEESKDVQSELEPLSWLVGNWEDAEEGLDVTFSWKWDLNNHFLVQNFLMKQEDETSLSGTQILGWDPIEKMIRSWVFDSDGGFGESRWNESEGKWYVETSFVTVDGEKATATYVYHKLDDNSFNFSSEVREVDGEILEDVGPYTFVRK